MTNTKSFFSIEGKYLALSIIIGFAGIAIAAPQKKKKSTRTAKISLVGKTYAGEWGGRGEGIEDTIRFYSGRSFSYVSWVTDYNTYYDPDRGYIEENEPKKRKSCEVFGSFSVTGNRLTLTYADPESNYQRTETAIYRINANGKSIEGLSGTLGLVPSLSLYAKRVVSTITLDDQSVLKLYNDDTASLKVGNNMQYGSWSLWEDKRPVNPLNVNVYIPNGGEGLDMFVTKNGLYILGTDYNSDEISIDKNGNVAIGGETVRPDNKVINRQ